MFDYGEDKETVCRGVRKNFTCDIFVNLQYIYFRKVQEQLEKLNISTNFNGKCSLQNSELLRIIKKKLFVSNTVCSYFLPCKQWSVPVARHRV
jgi:hypothetical protein